MSNKKQQPECRCQRAKELICPNFVPPFWQREALLNTSVIQHFLLDWTNKSAKCFVCSEFSLTSYGFLTIKLRT